MGWTGTHATFYKKGSIDRKTECDAIFSDYEIIKSSMRGTIYYAAMQHKQRRNDEGQIEEIPQEERTTFAVVVATQTDIKDYFNFYYKDMDETMGPNYYDCPLSILKLLSDTDHKWAIEWRQKCYETHEKKKRERNNPDALNNLPIGSTISFIVDFDNNVFDKGEKVTLTKKQYGYGRPIWCGYGYKWKKNLIPNDYVVLTR